MELSVCKNPSKYIAVTTNQSGIADIHACMHAHRVCTHAHHHPCHCLDRHITYVVSGKTRQQIRLICRKPFRHHNVAILRMMDLKSKLQKKEPKKDRNNHYGLLTGKPLLPTNGVCHDMCDIPAQWTYHKYMMCVAADHKSQHMS